MTAPSDDHDHPGDIGGIGLSVQAHMGQIPLPSIIYKKIQPDPAAVYRGSGRIGKKCLREAGGIRIANHQKVCALLLQKAFPDST